MDVFYMHDVFLRFFLVVVWLVFGCRERDIHVHYTQTGEPFLQMFNKADPSRGKFFKSNKSTDNLLHYGDVAERTEQTNSPLSVSLSLSLTYKITKYQHRNSINSNKMLYAQCT